MRLLRWLVELNGGVRPLLIRIVVGAAWGVAAAYVGAEVLR